jgi:hypothetical protein
LTHVAEPEPLAAAIKHSQTTRSTVAKDQQALGQQILLERILLEPPEPFNGAVEINWLDCREDLHRLCESSNTVVPYVPGNRTGLGSAIS